MQKSKFIIAMLLILIIGCNSNRAGNTSRADSLKMSKSNPRGDSVVQHHSSNGNECDTTITYDLENISSEGAEVEGCYINKYLVRAKISIYGSGGQSNIFYSFNGDTVDVIENNYTYQKPLAEVKNDTDMKLTDSTTYCLSINNKDFIKGKGSTRAVDILKKFIDNIPLKLN